MGFTSEPHDMYPVCHTAQVIVKMYISLFPIKNFAISDTVNKFIYLSDVLILSDIIEDPVSVT